MKLAWCMYLLHNSYCNSTSWAFCVWVKTLSNDFSIELTLNVYMKHINGFSRLVLCKTVAILFCWCIFLHLNLCTGHRKLCSLDHHVRRVRIFPDTIIIKLSWRRMVSMSKWYMVIQVSIALSGTVDRNWCFDNAHENDDHLVV